MSRRNKFVRRYFVSRLGLKITTGRLVIIIRKNRKVSLKVSFVHTSEQSGLAKPVGTAVNISVM